MRPSFEFANVYKLKSGMELVPGNVDVSCSDLTAMRRWTLDHWLKNVDGVLNARERHQRGELNKTDLGNHIKHAGFCSTPHGLLADLDLRRTTSFLDAFKFDFMHTAFQGGYMSNAMFLIIENTLQLKYGRATDGKPLVDFLKGLTFNMQHRNANKVLHRVFSDKMMAKHRKRKSIVANAGCQLALLKLIEFWAMEAAADTLSLIHI